MNSKLLTWLCFFLFLTGLSYYCYELGYFKALASLDKSKLSWLNLTLFGIMYSRLGILLFYQETPLEKDLDPGFEVAEYIMAIGLLGTVIGFILMLYGTMGNVNFDDPGAVRNLFTAVTSGMYTALITTAVGLITSLSLRAAYYLAGRQT